MARLLVKAVDYTHPDPDEDRRGSFKRGDVVAVMPDGHVWGEKEVPPLFEQVDVPGVSVSDLGYLTAPEAQTLDEITSAALRKNTRLVRLVAKAKKRDMKTLRRYSLDLSTLQITDKTR
jgi:hypothetical protein